MYSAFVKELVGRMPAIGRLEGLSAQLEQMGCPATRLAQQTQRVEELRGKVDDLKLSGAAYKKGLEAELLRQQQMDEMRLDFAERRRGPCRQSGPSAAPQRRSAAPPHRRTAAAPQPRGPAAQPPQTGPPGSGSLSALKRSA